MIEVKNLKIVINDKVLVQNIDFEIKENETVGIIGESGSGKTTIALGIIGLINKKDFSISGSIKFFQRELLELSEKELSKLKLSEMAMVYQNPFNTFSPVDKIGKQIEKIFKIKKIKKDFKKIKNLLEEISLTEKHLEKYPHELSGGELQRLVILTALLLNPKIIIFDEPTTSLDVETEEQIIKLIEKIKKNSKISILFISHDLNIIKKICDKIIIMKNGIIIEQGNMKKILENPIENYTKNLINYLRDESYVRN